MKSPNTLRRDIRGAERAQKWAMANARSAATLTARRYWVERARGHARSARSYRRSLHGEPLMQVV